MRWRCRPGASPSAQNYSRRFLPSLIAARLVVDSLVDLRTGEPAAAVAKFAREATAAGFEITEQSANKMLEFFCSRRSCRRTLPPPLTARVEPHGEIAVAPWDDPADVVEALLKAEPDLTLSDGDDMTAPMLAQLFDQEEVVELFKAAGVTQFEKKDSDDY